MTPGTNEDDHDNEASTALDLTIFNHQPEVVPAPLCTINSGTKTAILAPATAPTPAGTAPSASRNFHLDPE